jgi:mRNA interferase HigB
MRVIARRTLVAFYARHRETKASLQRWHSLTKRATWKSPTDVQATFANAVALNRERMRFEVAGGNFRMIVAFNFQAQIAFVKFIGTHEPYDKIDALSVSQY